MPSQSQHSVRGRSHDPRRDRRHERPRTPERPPMTYPKSAPPPAPSSGRHGEAGGPGTAGAYQRRREGEYGRRHGERKDNDKTRHEKKRKRRSTKDKADHVGRHDKKKTKKEPAEKAKEKPKEKAVPAKDKPASSGDDDSSSSSSEDSKETVIEEAPKVPAVPAAAEGSGNQIMVSAISSRMDEMTAVAMSFSRSLVRAQQALRTSARIARDAAMGFESEMENFSRAEKEINETFGLKFDTEEK